MRIRGAAAALCLVAALGACGDDPEPRTVPPVPSASPSVSVVALPSEAAAETPEGAAAFARYFFEVVGAAFASADPAALQAVSAPGCGGCDALITSVKELQEQGRKRVGGTYVLKSVAAPPVEAGDVTLEISYERAAGQVVDASGRVYASAAPVPPTNAQLRLIRRGSSWVVQGYRVVQP